MHEKMYDFEQSKRNNLIFYGIQADENETNKTLANKILNIIKNVIGVKREMFLSEVSRLDTGPAITNTKSRPVVASFSNQMFVIFLLYIHIKIIVIYPDLSNDILV